MRGALKAVAIGLIGISVSACQPEPEEALPGYAPTPTNTLEQSCLQRGGEFKLAGRAGRMMCFTTPADAGKSCRVSSDCSTGNCLSRSKTCAPISPLLGCNDILDRAGRQVTLCVD